MPNAARMDDTARTQPRSNWSRQGMVSRMSLDSAVVHKEYSEVLTPMLDSIPSACHLTPSRAFPWRGEEVCRTWESFASAVKAEATSRKLGRDLPNDYAKAACKGLCCRAPFTQSGPCPQSDPHVRAP